MVQPARINFNRLQLVCDTYSCSADYTLRSAAASISSPVKFLVKHRRDVRRNLFQRVDCHVTHIRVTTEFLIGPRHPYSDDSYLTTCEESS